MLETIPRPRLAAVIARLAQDLAPPPVPSEPFALILWENIGYLIDDQRRRTLFDAFVARIGLSPAAILAADEALLFELAERGGMRPDVRVELWLAIANIVQTDCNGDLSATISVLPLPKARALLKRFPTIGDPGADKILLFCGLAVRPCLESNGLRVLARLGYFQEQPSYNTSYKAAIAVLAAEGVVGGGALIQAHAVLREHGKVLCRRGTPFCTACPLEEGCPKVVVKAL